MVDKEEIEKKYYQIGEVANMFEVKPSLIRFWAAEFPTLRPRKNKKGNRIFTKDDIQEVRNIFYLVKTKKYTLDGARNALKNKGNQVTQNQQITESLIKIKDFLVELKKAF